MIHISYAELIYLYLQKDYYIILKYLVSRPPPRQNDYCMDKADEVMASVFKLYPENKADKIMTYLFKLDKTDMIVTLSEYHSDADILDKIIEFDSEKILRLILERNSNFIKNTNLCAKNQSYERIGNRLAYSNKLNLLKICLENGYGPNDTFIQLILKIAIRDNNPAMVSYLLESGTDAQDIFDNIMSENDLSTLILKCHFNLEMVLILVENNIDVTKHINKLNILAIGHVKLDFVKYCVSNGADPTYENNYPIKKACDGVNLDISVLLLEYGADINRIGMDDLTGVFWSDDLKGLAYMKFLIANGFDYVEKIHSLFLKSISADTCGLVSYFVELGADIHEQDELALFIAAYNQCGDAIDILLDLGADIHALNDSILAFMVGLVDPFDVKNNDYFGMPYHDIYVDYDYFINIFKKLLKYGAIVSDQKILVAISSDYNIGADIEIVQYLLSAGIDINAKYEVCLRIRWEAELVCVLSPLEASICNDHNTVAKFLIQNGAACGDALKLAIKYENLEIIELLLESDQEVNFEYDASEKVSDLLEKHGIEKKLII